MAQLVMQIRGDGIRKFKRACDALGSKKARTGYRRALNRTNDKALTQVKKALGPQVGLSQSKIMRLGATKKIRASDGSLSAAITSTGRYLSLKEFGARQFSYGVRAKPWGKSQRFEAAFIFAGTPNSGKFVAGGHVFKNTGGPSARSGRNNAVEKMFGPAIPKEIVKDASAEAWRSAANSLDNRVEHEIRQITNGVVK